jgi:fluoroquinolone resistance protein
MKDLEDYADRVFVEEVLEEEVVEKIEYLDCTFERCSFTSVSFKNCRFTGCTFDACDLSLSNWEGSRLSGVRFKKCKAIGIDWTLADWPLVPMRDAVTFSDSAINHSTFLGLKLPVLRIENCVAREADFREADLEKADFSGTDLTGSLFSATNLAGADLTSARNYRIPPAENRLGGAKFSLPEAIALLHCMEIKLVE